MSNVYKAIQIMSIILMVIEIIFCLIFGILFLQATASWEIIIGLFLLFVGIPISIFFGLLGYGFGQLIDNTQRIAKANAMQVNATKAALITELTASNQLTVDRKTLLDIWKSVGILSNATYKQELQRLQQTKQNVSAYPNEDPEDPFA